MTSVLIGVVLALSVYGQLIVKARAIVYSEGEPMSRAEYLVLMFTDVHVWAGLGAAVAASVFWILAIERAHLSFAYPFMALSFVLVPIGSQIWFGEPVSPLQYTGIGLICAGVGLNAIGR